MGRKFKLGLATRLELKNSVELNLSLISIFSKIYKREIIGLLNHYYSQVSSVNNVCTDLQRFNIIRLYLIRSYKGKCHALGKPTRGQRTWSNAWTSFRYNNHLRKFIGESKKKLEREKRPEKINFKMTKKKYVTKQKKVKKIQEKKLVWF